MNVQQTILYTAAGEAIRKEYTIPLQPEGALGSQVENDVVNLYPQVTYQTVDGFGGAMTESAAYLLSKMPRETRREFMEYLFGANGLDYRFLRVHLDSCDYSLSEYQAVEDPMADPELATFSLKRDQQYILPMLREALSIGKSISVLLSPWSPPACWKTPPTRKAGGEAVYGIMGGSISEEPSRCNGGSLKPEYYGPWAKYMVKFVKAYLAEGIPVSMLSVQNEEVAATNWDSCVWTAQQEQTFIRDYLYPEMEREGIAESVGLFVWDHNKERAVERAAVTFCDEAVRRAVAGVAFHWYSGDHFEAVEILHKLYPEKLLISSECCEFNMAAMKQSPLAGFLGLDKQSDGALERKEAEHYAHDILGNLNAGMHRWIDWNLILDPTGGPRHVEGGGFTATVVANPDGSYHKKLSAQYVGAIAEAIRPGAVRIGHTKCSSGFEMTAVQNPDGSLAAVLLNTQDADTGVNLRLNGQLAHIYLPGHTISTVKIS